MFEFDWGKLVVIGIVALIVIGPKELPAVLRTVGQWVTKIRRMASEFQGQFQDAMREAEMADLKKQVESVGELSNDFSATPSTTPTEPEPETATESTEPSAPDEVSAEPLTAPSVQAEPQAATETQAVSGPQTASEPQPEPQPDAAPELQSAESAEPSVPQPATGSGGRAA
jgi:sec-independent protein translocase protein TatB